MTWILLTSFRLQRQKVTCSVSSHPRWSHQLECPYLSGLINYYHIILYEQNHEKKQLDDQPQVCSMAILFVHETSGMEKTGYVSFFNENFEIQRDTQFCSAIPTDLGQLRKLHVCMILCLFITVAVGSLCVACMCACLHAFACWEACEHYLFVSFCMEKINKIWEIGVLNYFR